MLAVWLLIGAAISLAVRSLAEDRGRLDWLRSHLHANAVSQLPPATVIVPVKGHDEGLRENLAALAHLEYPDYELIVTARDESDVPAGVLPPNGRLVIAGEGPAENGEKINNLLAAVAATRESSEILAFADSDGRVSPQWLTALAGALSEPESGAATGYRWYLPEPADFWSLIRSAWNGVIAGDFGPGEPRFAWGGAMAIRREDFYHLEIPRYWHGSISDDYALTAAVRDAGLKITYAPGAVVASHDLATARDLLEWTRRQLLITRFYQPSLWRLGLFAHVIYCGAMTASLILALQGNLTGVYTLLAQLSLGIWKGANRLASARVLLPDYSSWFRSHGWIHVWGVPVVTWLWLCTFLASAGSNRITWRGRAYRLHAPPYRRVNGR